MSTQQNEKQIEVAIIGGGLAGLTAGLRLSQANETSFAVFEAKERVGGRTVNQPTADGRFVEGGGQYVGQTQTRVLALAEELDVDTFPTYERGRSIAILSGKRYEYTIFPLTNIGLLFDFARAVIKLHWAARQVDRDRPWEHKDAQKLDHTTFDQWLTKNVKTHEARTILYAISMQTLGGDPAEFSVLWALQHMQSAGGLLKLITTKGGAQERRFIKGSQEMSLRIAKKLGDHLRLNSPVDKIEWDDSGARIYSGGNVTFAKKVIIAMSPPDWRHIQFSPDLPDARKSLAERMKMDKSFKVHLIYDKPFWRDAGLSGSVMADSGIAAAVSDNTHPDNPHGILMTFIAGSVGDNPIMPSQEQLTDPAKRKAAIIDCMVNYFGEAAHRPIDYIEQDWSTAPYNEGCIPTVQPGVLTDLGSKLHEQDGPFIWAGTETSHIWNAYMDGAVRSGERAAELART